MSRKIAVLAVQGAFAEHERMLEGLGCECVELRQAADLQRDFDGLVLPGGESTTQGKLLDELKAGKVHYDFVEVMACPGGCVGGGGQPIHDGEERADVLGNKLYTIDSNRPLHQSHNNPDVQELYKDFLEKPLSEKAEQLLHSDHVKEHNYM